MNKSAKTPERVLLVDDEPDVQGLLLFNLKDAGFETEAVGTGTDALPTAQQWLPSVVVLALMLPDISGIEVCRRLRAVPAWPTRRSSC